MEAGHFMTAIDEMDIFFYFDILAYKMRKEEYNNVKACDDAGF